MKIDSKQIKIELIRQGKNVEWLANKTGYTRQAIYVALRNGGRTLTLLGKIAEALNIDGRQLITKE